MTIQATAVWRVRTDGNNVNGAGFDSGISGAGTDYSQQGTAQLALSDIACSNTTTVTSATGGFTSAMIGNAIRITGGGATSGYYFITGQIDTNTITVDRAPGTVSGGAGNVGGAALTLDRLLTAANATGDKVASGSTVYVRANGTSSDYTYSALINMVSGDTTNGAIAIIGENGTPTFVGSGQDLLFFNGSYIRLENLSIKAGGVGNFRVVDLTDFEMRNCIINTNNLDIWGVWVEGNGSTIIGCELWSGTTSPTAGTSTRGLISVQGGAGNLFVGNAIHHSVSCGIVLSDGGGAADVVLNNLIYQCKSDGIRLATVTSLVGITITQNTIDANAGNGISIPDTTTMAHVRIFNNIISNHNQAGKYGVAVAGGTTTLNDSLKRFLDYNDYFGNTANLQNLSMGPNTLTLDPQYTNAGASDYSIGTNLKAKGFPAAINSVGTASYVDLGAAQRQETGGAGGISKNRLIGGI